MGYSDEPRQVENTGHILGDSTSRVWREVKDSNESKVSSVLKCISWLCFSSLVFKLVRIIAATYSSVFVSIAIFIVLAPLSMALYSYLSTHERRFNAFVWLSIVILGFVIGSL